MKWIDIPQHKDERGSLGVIDGQIPFTIKRVFYMYDVKSMRGGHGHFKTQMVLLAVKGSCVIEVVSKAEGHKTVQLEGPEKGLLLEPNEWHLLKDFTEDAVVMVFASTQYDPKDYFYERPD